jgi:hypothetical protein
MKLSGFETNLERKLLSAARRAPANDKVPYAFEKRVMAHLGSARPLDSWALWGRSLWQAAASCVIITIVVGLWSVSPVNVSGAASAESDLSQDFENTVMASMDQHLEVSW